MTAAITIAGLDHVVLRVRNRGAMLDFYTNVLGCVPERRVDEIGLDQLGAGTALIDLIAADDTADRNGPPNMDHFCLRVADWDEVALRRHLESKGIDAGPVERRYGAEGSGPSIYITDPEGNVVELKGPPDGA